MDCVCDVKPAPSTCYIAPMPVAESPRHLARLLWGMGLRRWHARNLTWNVEQPIFTDDAVTFLFTRLGSQVQIRVQASLPSAATNLEVVLVSVGHDRVASELCAIIEKLDERGLSLRPPSLPLSGPRVARRMELFIASGCTLSCYFCCESKRIQKRTLMPWSTVEQRLHAAAEDGVEVVQFMGGEATLHPRFSDALRLAKSLGMGTYVITNLLRWESRQFAEDVGPWLDEIMVSMHAFGTESGAIITGKSMWFERFSRAADNARETLQGAVRCSTVLNRFNLPDLERIADTLMTFRPSRWIMGCGVPITGSRLPVIANNLTLHQLHAIQPRLVSLQRRVAAEGCQLIFFCIPHCVLGPELWDSSHDQVVGDQDLSDQAPAETQQVNFWSRADYLDALQPVTLGRSRPEPCGDCLRRTVCGGWFTEYFETQGVDGLRPIHQRVS